MSDPQHVDDVKAQSRSNMSDRQKIELLRKALTNAIADLEWFGAASITLESFRKTLAATDK